MAEANPPEGRSEIVLFGRLAAAEAIPLPVGHRQQDPPRGAQLPPLERRRRSGRAAAEVSWAVDLDRHFEPALRDHCVQAVALRRAHLLLRRTAISEATDALVAPDMSVD